MGADFRVKDPYGVWSHQPLAKGKGAVAAQPPAARGAGKGRDGGDRRHEFEPGSGCVRRQHRNLSGDVDSRVTILPKGLSVNQCNSPDPGVLYPDSRLIREPFGCARPGQGNRKPIRCHHGVLPYLGAEDAREQLLNR